MRTSLATLSASWRRQVGITLPVLPATLPYLVTAKIGTYRPRPLLAPRTSFSIIRIIVDYPEKAEEVLIEHRFAYETVPVVAIELQSESQLKDVTRFLLGAEINIYYVYPFLFRPNGRYGLVLRTEAQDLAASVLQTHGIQVIGRGDVAR
jgi:hypothetical protein